MERSNLLYRVTVKSSGAVLVIAVTGATLLLLSAIIANLIPALLGVVFLLTTPWFVWHVDIFSEDGLVARPISRFPALRVAPSEISTVDAVRVTSVLKYGGIGLRSRVGERALLFGTGRAVQIVRRDGVKVTIVVDDPEELMTALNAIVSPT